MTDAQLTTKRILVRNDNLDIEVQDTKKQRLDLDVHQKDTCLLAIAASYVALSTYMQMDIMNLHDGQQCANVLKSLFLAQRQKANNSGTLVSRHESKPFTVTIRGTKKTFARKDVDEVVVRVWSAFGLKFDKPSANTKNWWWGTFAPLLSYFCAWGERLSELRVGHARFVRKKEEVTTADGQKEKHEKVVQVKDFGLYPQHHILLEGVSFAPELRSSMAQSVGPMTAVIALCNETGDSKFQKKYRDAVGRIFSHVPNIESIIEALVGKPAHAVAPLVRQLADLCLLVPARNQRRAHFPINFLVAYVLSAEDIDHYSCKYDKGKVTHYPTDLAASHVMQKKAAETLASKVASGVRSLFGKSPRRSPSPPAKKTKTGAEKEAEKTDEMEVDEATGQPKAPATIPDQSAPATVEEATPYKKIYWDHSGHGVALIYQKCFDQEWKVPKGAGATVENMSQATFHAVYGSFSEDFSLLKWITDKPKWMTRKEMGNFIERYGTTKEVLTISLPHMKYYSKLISSNITSFLTEQNEQLSSYPVWSGKRTLGYSAGLIESLSTNTKGPKHHGKDVHSLAEELARETEAIAAKVANGERVEMGTVKWRKTDGITATPEGKGEEIEDTPSLSGVFFLAREN